MRVSLFAGLDWTGLYWSTMVMSFQSRPLTLQLAGLVNHPALSPLMVRLGFRQGPHALKETLDD